MGALWLALVFFGLVTLRNVLMRNFAAWFGGAPPGLLSSASFLEGAVLVLFLFVPLTLAYCVLARD